MVSKRLHDFGYHSESISDGAQELAAITQNIAAQTDAIEKQTEATDRIMNLIREVTDSTQKTRGQGRTSPCPSVCPSVCPILLVSTK